MRRRLPVLLAAAALVVVAGCGTSGSPATPDSGGVTRYDGSARKAAPALTGPTIAGAAYAGVAGKVTVVNFWASWCDPCKAETDGLVGVAKRYPGVAFVGVDEDHAGTAPAVAFARAHAVPYPSVWDSSSGISARWGVPGLPVTFVLDEDRRIALRVIGKVTPAVLTPTLDRLARGA